MRQQSDLANSQMLDENFSNLEGSVNAAALNYTQTSGAARGAKPTTYIGGATSNQAILAARQAAALAAQQATANALAAQQAAAALAAQQAAANALAAQQAAAANALAAQQAADALAAQQAADKAYQDSLQHPHGGWMPPPPPPSENVEPSLPPQPNPSPSTDAPVTTPEKKSETISGGGGGGEKIYGIDSTIVYGSLIVLGAAVGYFTAKKTKKSIGTYTAIGAAIGASISVVHYKFTNKGAVTPKQTDQTTTSSFTGGRSKIGIRSTDPTYGGYKVGDRLGKDTLHKDGLWY